MKKKIMVLFLVFAMSISTIVFARNFSYAESAASSLKSLGLFKGVSANDFGLEREPTRVEALVMLIRMLGKEQEALGKEWRHPFSDVPAWADRYVGYAYQNNLTNGVSTNEFGSGNASASTYLTFVLRALGYSDANSKDFSWKDPFTLSKSVGLLTTEVDTVTFLRADVAIVSYNSLAVKMKGKSTTLADKLISDDVFTRQQYNKNYKISSNSDGDSELEMTSEDISKKCASAVFKVTTYAFNGKLSGTGSGFFVSSDGLAITNCHVVANSLKIEVKTVDGKVYDDVKIVAYDSTNDLALLKIDEGRNFNYLEYGDSSKLVQGQKVYAIGSPLGLENTLSQGIISNTNRVDGTSTFIQISVPIDHGSSGGALIDTNGKVVGVTAAGYESTGNLNLAIPINIAKKLKKETNKGYTIYSTKTYPGLTSVIDFGAFTNVNLISSSVTALGSVEYYYDFFDFQAIDGLEEAMVYAYAVTSYVEALENNGFVCVEYNNDGFSGTYCNYTTKEIIVTSISSETQRIIISALHIPDTYLNFSEIPDFGKFTGLSGTQTEGSNGSTIYTYRWSSAYTSDGIIEETAMYVNICRYIFKFEIAYGEGNAVILSKDNSSVGVLVDNNYVMVVLASGN